MKPDDRQTSRATENRLSVRVLRRIPLRIEWDDCVFDAHTGLISAHGALILCPVLLPEGATVRITNTELNRTAQFRVRWPGQQDGALYRTGVELLKEVEFWGPGYDDAP